MSALIIRPAVHGHKPVAIRNVLRSSPLCGELLPLVAFLLVMGFAGWQSGTVAPPASSRNTAVPSSLTAVMATTRGEVQFTLYADRAPVNVASFVNLALRGFYDGLTFDRVISRTAVEGGCPLGKGIGWPGYKTEDEFHPTLRHNGPGFISLLNAGPDTNGCRFTIILRPIPTMDDRNTIIGRVTSGMDAVRKLVDGDRIESIRILGDASPLLLHYKTRVEEWNAVLDARFPKLRPATPPPTATPETAPTSSAPDKSTP